MVQSLAAGGVGRTTLTDGAFSTLGAGGEADPCRLLFCGCVVAVACVETVPVLIAIELKVLVAIVDSVAARIPAKLTAGYRSASIKFVELTGSILAVPGNSSSAFRGFKQVSAFSRYQTSFALMTS